MMFDGIDEFDAMYGRCVEEYEMREGVDSLYTFEDTVRAMSNEQVAALENCYHGALDIITERHMMEHFNRALTMYNFVAFENDSRAMMRDFVSF